MAAKSFKRRNQLSFSATLMLLGALTSASDAVASEFSGVATLSSEYIYRGLKMSDGNPAFQLGLDYEHGTGFFVGAWASTIDLLSPVGQRDIELDYYAGFHYLGNAPISATITLLRYTYPGQTGTHPYDYNEVLVGATWREHYSVELGYTNSLYGLDRTARHWELRSEWPIANAWMISATLGGTDMSDAGVSRYLHWDLGASARFSRLTFDLRWFDNEQPDGFATNSSANAQVVLSISAAF